MSYNKDLGNSTMKILLLISLLAAIVIAVSGRECPLCKDDPGTAAPCTCSGNKIPNGCGGLPPPGVCIIAQNCCEFPKARICQQV
ncbi:CLUMA_CG017578, isoform A [Clunio marinus]|uniref:CLUMA_CG017578, isoform A n=1 Tax=Clunio marinus TaxID=568069 RepID=A0A1J1IXQ5_9DIPT|nr:CLUMA_CG017578, isoform A [Clunio marinus]